MTPSRIRLDHDDVIALAVYRSLVPVKSPLSCSEANRRRLMRLREIDVG